MASSPGVKYLRFFAAGHAFLIQASRVDRITEQVAGETLDLSVRLGGEAPGRVMILCGDGPALAVDAVEGLIALPQDALKPAAWLPRDAAALVDAVSTAGWRLRASLGQ